MRATLAAASLLAACADTCAPAPIERCVDAAPDLTAGVAAPLWHRDVLPIVEAKCARCHVQGGVAPFSLSTYDDVVARKEEIKSAVVARRMPPFPPAHCCAPIANDPSLTDAQIATIARFVDDGAPEGDPDDVGAPLPVPGGLARVDLELTMPDAYRPQPPPGGTDDTRCFLLFDPFDRDTSVTGVNIAPGTRPFVHHALVLLVDDDQRRALEALDDADPAPGWSCPGGVVLGMKDWLGGWSPGWDGVTTPAGFGHRVSSTDSVVLTVHYSLHEGLAPDDLPPDRTTVQLMIDDDVAGELVAVSVFDARWPFAMMPIPKDADDVRYAVEYDPTDVLSPGKALTAFSANVHMHERGKSAILGVKHADGTTECLVQIDDWAHAWQGDYTFTVEHALAPDDQVYLECVFDNTAGNQKPGESPRDLNWAEDGEMCVAFITVAQPDDLRAARPR